MYKCYENVLDFMAIMTSDEKKIPDEIPDEIPDGYYYFLYKVWDSEKETFGCFIGQDPHDVEISDGAVGFEPGSQVVVCKVTREEYIDFSETIDAANLNDTLNDAGNGPAA